MPADTLNAVAEHIQKATRAAVESRMEGVGAIISGATRRLVAKDGPRDTGAFYDAIDHAKRWVGDTLVVYVGSRVPYEPYVLGGRPAKVTPPPRSALLGWVERHLDWTYTGGKKAGQPMSAEDKAAILQHVIYKRGIKPNNPFAKAINENKSTIENYLSKPLEVTL